LSAEGGDVTQGAYDSCELCPRRCRAQRSRGACGLCGATSTLRIARAALHFWEEPPISGESGSGAIFFSGCPLRCVFCQNHDISHDGFGVEVTASRLARMMLELEMQGALNINLVTPLHFAPHVHEAVLLARKGGLSVPIVCNTSGYELATVVRDMSDVGPSSATRLAMSLRPWCVTCPMWWTCGSPTSSTRAPRSPPSSRAPATTQRLPQPPLSRCSRAYAPPVVRLVLTMGP